MASLQATRAFWILLLGMSAGCGDESVNIGDEKQQPADPVLEDYAGQWDGYIEASTFESGSDRIRLTLNEAGEGTLEFGDAEPLPPATDPDVAYPPGADAPTTGVVEGYAYAVQRLNVTGYRIRLGIEPGELFVDWCGMQTPIMNEPKKGDTEEIYECVPSWNIEEQGEESCTLRQPSTDETMTLDCGKVRICRSTLCSCNESACWATATEDSEPLPYELDARLEEGGNLIRGTLQRRSTPYNVRLERR